MASRYLVAGAGGTKNWSDTSIWSATSGGSTGETAPTLNDAVIMDAASLSGTLILTLDAASACASLDSSALDNICTITGSVYTLSIYGSLTEHATNSRYNLTGTSYLYFKGTGSITSNGNTYHVWNRWYTDANGITTTLADALNVGATAIYLANGTLDTNGQTLTTTGTVNTATGTKALTLGASTINIGGWANTVPTGFTFTPGTSTVNITGTGTLTGANTFYNLTFTGAAAITAAVSLASNITVSGAFNPTGQNANTQRILTQSSVIGTARTITCNGTITATNCDFQDITLAGTASRDFSSQSDIGDAGGNTGITFPAAVACHAVSAANFNVSNAAKWFLSDLTTPARVPLPQDSATFGAGITAPLTVTMDCPRIGSVDMSGVTVAMGWTLGNAFACYGHYVLGNNVTQSGNFTLTLAGRGSYNLNTYGKNIYALYINAFGGTYTNLSNLVITAGVGNGITAYVILGTFDINDFNLYCHALLNNTGQTLYLGNGTIECFNNDFVRSFRSDGTLYSEGSTILLTPASGSSDITFAGGGKTFNRVIFSGAHTGNFIISGSNTFAHLEVEPGRKLQVTAGTTQTITATGRLKVDGSIDSTTASPFTIAYAGTGYHQSRGSFKSCTAPANRVYTTGANGGGNTNVLFKNYLKVPQVID